MFSFRSVVPILALASPPLAASQEPSIAHLPVTCLPMDQHSVIGAETIAGHAMPTARLYFRSNIFGVFYYVDMTKTAEAFHAVLPKPEPTVDSVVYYIEAQDALVGATRTPEYEAFVMSDAESCRSQGFEVAVHSGTGPRIVLGSESPGVPATPPGFLPDGIVESRIPPGPSPDGGGAGTKIGLALGGAAAAIAGVALLGGATPETEVPEPISPPPPSGPSVPVPVACFETDPNPPVIAVGERITLDGRCSTPRDGLTFSWDLGDGRRRDGPFIQPSYDSPGSFPVELVVRLTSESSRTDRAVKWIDVRAPTRSVAPATTDPSQAARLRTSFVSELSGGPRGRVQASVELNQQLPIATDNTSPRQIVSLGLEGENLGAGIARATDLENVLWRFDFSGADHFESGSLRVELGEVLSMSSDAVVFRLAGTEGRVRFRFRLAR